jgi:hypothetical protein
MDGNDYLPLLSIDYVFIFHNGKVDTQNLNM